MPKQDEPLFLDVKKNSLKGEESIELVDDIRKLCESQPFAVLATQGKGITHASLISFSVSYDLKYIVFATPVNTGKFDFITAEENVSVLVDDRSLQQDSINQISALTIIGKGRVLSDQSDIVKWSEQLIKKHPNLNAFVKASTTSLILIEVEKHLYVKNFQEIKQWDPR
ncbi:pyridoxamine 5'-phosphate oxidase family protein [Proteocatella sphenisci]|uniref:pyridoxamine 5'-phosphate oxidase family protein n=1 Tax=Proteocatella sphenisci TaxID=181070 RepID=UPI00048B43DE|nr:pyridoxamine 5'-phosphate oxidase family protein [Proteocatella sphenisci]